MRQLRTPIRVVIMNSSIAYCRKGNRCKQFRDCPDCAKIRQAKIADIAETGSLQSPYLTYAVVKPLNDKTYTEEKKRIMKAVSNNSDGGLWTVETGIESGLHTNLVIGSSKPFDMNILYEAVRVESSIWGNTALNHKEVRNVASYSAKQKGMPGKEEYTGNLYGRFGTFKTPLAICAENTISPVMAGVALEQMLADRGIEAPKSDFMQRPLGGNDTPEAMRERYKHNEAESDRFNRDMDNHKIKDEAYKRMQRMLAVVAGEIELHGMVYLPQYGIVDKVDLKKFGITDIS